jgi:hypothetical protein
MDDGNNQRQSLPNPFVPFFHIFRSSPPLPIPIPICPNPKNGEYFIEERKINKV